MLHKFKNHWKDHLIPLLVAILIFTSFLTPAFGQEILLYQESQGFPVTGGVTYEEQTIFTSQGWQKIHILRADLTSDNVDIDTIIGNNGLSQRAPLNKMVQDNGAIAGINGDFFIMATPSAPIGPQISNGKLISTPLNLQGMSSIAMTYDKIPQILTMTFSGKLIAPDRSYYFVDGVNKIRDSYNHIFVYTPEFGQSTPKPGNGAPNLTFLTVKDNTIINISEGQTTEIPKDGLVLMAWGEGAAFMKGHFQIGDPVELELSIAPDISNLKMALGGGAVLVDNGAIPQTFAHNIAGTHPRTAIGFTADKKTMIMVVVDGRQAQSRGMTQQELAQLMLNLGAYNALNLDGGGSSTMVARPFCQTQTQVLNSVSEGVQRLITNAVAIFAREPVGQIYGLNIASSSFNIAKSGHMTFQAQAYDKNYNLIDLDSSKVVWSVSNDIGHFEGNVFVAEKSGTGKVTASFGDIQASSDIRVLKDGVTLAIEPSKVQVNPGAKTTFQVSVTDTEGFKALLDPSDIKWEVVGDIGSMSGLEFTAGQTPANGAVIGEFSGLTAGALVQVGYYSQVVDNFETLNGKNFTSYPADVKGAFSIVSAPEPVYSGQASGRLDYDFTAGNATRAAYLSFGNSGKALPLNTSKISLWVYGDNQGEWLRASVNDVSGKETILDLARSVDWDGWKQIEVTLPSGKQPFTLKTIYVVETDPEASIKGAVYFDDLTALIAGNYNESLLPQSTVWTDAANQKGSGFTFGAVGAKPLVNPDQESYNKTLSAAAKIINNSNASLTLVVGQPWADNGSLSSQLKDFRNYKITGKGYAVSSEKGANFMLLDATKGSLRLTDYNQWINLQKDLASLDKSKALFVVLDRMPENFSDTLEGDLLKKILISHAKSSGSSVWVIGGAGAAPFSSRAEDGVHFVSIPSINSPEPATVVFNVSDQTVNYQVIPIVDQIVSETVTVKAGTATNLKIYGVSPAGSKMLLGYPYTCDWKVSYSKPVGFDTKTLAFKAVDPGTATIEVKVGNISKSFPIIITDISVVVNGKEVVFPDELPYVNQDNRTMVPVRFVSESLGAQVEWDNDNRMVIICKDDKTIKLKIGESKADVNGKTVTFDTSAIIQNSRTMVPVRFISEALGAKVSWNQTTKTVEIQY